MSGAASSVVPLDTFDNLRSQYDGVVGFLSLVRLCMHIDLSGKVYVLADEECSDQRRTTFH